MCVCGLFYTELELIPKNLTGDDIIIEGVGEESEVEGEHDVNANSGMLNDAFFLSLFITTSKASSMIWFP